MKLRSYQRDILAQVKASRTNDLVQLDTGAGKTPIEAALAAHYPAVMLLAHRNLLISQMSEKMAAWGLPHDTISTEHTRRRCIVAHRRHGHAVMIQRGHTDRLAVSVDSLLAHVRHHRLHIDTGREWVVVIDEAHHALPDNKWGRLREILPNARFIGFTATPARADGESLHVSNGGLFDRLVQAESLADDSVSKLIGMGYLSGFDVYSPEAGSIRYDGSGGRQLAVAGDPVQFYREHLSGLRAVMFCPSIKNAEEFAEQFRAAGVASAHISSTLSQVEVAARLDAFDAGSIQVLTNVDMVSEGFDLPGIEAVILAKRTASFVMFRQWCGRALRPSPGKRKAVIVDHCDNVLQHGMPDDPVHWDIMNPPRGLGTLKKIPCHKCGLWYPVKDAHCPGCGAENKLLTRETIGGFYVDIVSKLDARLLRQAREEREAARREDILSKELARVELVGDTAIDRAVNRLRWWFTTALLNSGVPMRAVNQFVLGDEFRDNLWWIKRFTIADEGNDGKAVREYKKWLKSR